MAGFLGASSTRSGARRSHRPAPTFPPSRHLEPATVQVTAGALAQAQAKLEVGAPDDEFEREAEQTAQTVMRMSAAESVGGVHSRPPRIQRMCTKCDEEQKLQRSPDGTASASSPTTADASDGAGPSSALGLGSGRALPTSERRFFEPRFGTDFSRVRIHTDERADRVARQVSAQAFTLGNDLVFRKGTFAPGTSSGRHLLAHELTHVIQQDGGSRTSSSAPHTLSRRIRRRSAQASAVQRLACDTTAVDKDCNGADKSCQSIQAKYCAKKYPTKSDIDKLHASATSGATTYTKTYPNAAANLLHFLGGTGKEQVMASALFEADDSVKDQLKGTHRRMFIKGAEKRLADGRLKPGGSVDMVWTDSASAFSFLKKTDLGLAVGGFTLCSKVTVSARDKGGGSFEITFDTWTVQAFDCYNWDPGKGVGIPGADDNDLCCLQNAGRGKHFWVRTNAWANSEATSMASTTVSATLPSTAPPPTPKKKDADR